MSVGQSAHMAQFTSADYRLGFVLKCPKKRLLKADPARRAAFVAEYAVPTAEAHRTGAKIFFADEAHFQADGDLRGKWVLQGEPALVDSTSPRRGEKASYYSAVCLETGDVELMGLEDNSNAATSAAFLGQLRARFDEPLTVIWDNSPAHRGDALRAHLVTPELRLRPVNLPSYSPDFNADEAIWGWVRQEVTANLCLGTKAAVQDKVGDFFARLADRREEVKRRCRTVLQARAEELIEPIPRWDVHFGILKMTERAPRLLLSPSGPNWGRPLQCGLAICTSHLGFSLEAAKPIFTAPQMYIPPWLQFRKRAANRRPALIPSNQTPRLFEVGDDVFGEALQGVHDYLAGDG